MEAHHEAVVNEIRHLVNIAKPQIRRFRIEIENKEVMVCLGNTRAGKSTVVNYVQGNELEAFEDGKRTYIRVKNLVHAGPVISHGSISYTKFPTVWEIREKSDAIIVDVPGFEDNRGVAHDVVNTLFFNQLKHARSVSLVLIADINDIDNDNVRGFTKAIAKVQSIIDDFNELKDAVSVIFTKDCKHYQKEDIAMLLKKKILNVPEMQVKKELVYHIIKHVNTIGILRMPFAGGRVTKEEVDCNIEGAIYSSHPIIINANEIRFTPSELSHHVLLDIYQDCVVNLNFLAEAKRCVNRFEKYFTVDKYVFASTEEELGDTKTHLQFVLPRITTEKLRILPNVADVKESLCHIAGWLSEDFKKRLNFLRFMDDWSVLDDSVKQILTTKYKDGLASFEDEINKLISKIDLEVADRTKETFQYILSEAASDRTKLVLMGASFIPLAKKTLATVGVQLPEGFAFEIVQFSGAGCGLAGAGAIGVAAGGSSLLYYKTVALRKALRKEQGR